MGVWSTLLKYGGKAMKGVGTATATTGKSMGKAVLHPSQTLRGAGQAVKTATIGGAVGYVGWEKLTTDKSVVRIVSDAVIGEPATNTLAETADGVRELTGKAGEAVSSVSGAVTGIDNKLNGVSNFLRQASGGGGLDMFGNFFRNLGSGNVSGLSIAGLVAAVPHIRTLRLAGQDCRRIPRHDAHRQQCGCLPNAGDRKRAAHPDARTSGRGTDAWRRDEKIGI